MNESEKRRKALLESARALYRDGHVPPAIHPRYGNLYRGIYEDEPGGSFGIRMILCCVLFALFVMMDYRDVSIADVSSEMVTQAIEAEDGLTEVWNNLKQ